MKKILGLSIAAFLIIAIVGGGTWAFFSDTQDSSGNTLIAGTLDLGLANTDIMATTSTTATWTSTNWEPGETASGNLTISNSGTIDMDHLTISFDYGDINVDNRPDDISGSPWELSTDQFDQMITATTATFGGTTVDEIEGNTLAQLKAAGSIDLGTLTAGTKKTLVLTFTFSNTATNGCQGNSVDVTVTVVGTQS